MSNSIWSVGSKIQIPQYEKLKQIKKADVTIVGGGLCGVLCAYFLKDTGVKCILLEENRIGEGEISNAMAQVTSQHGIMYSQFIETHGKEMAAMYLQANQTALMKYKELSESIACDFEEKSSYVYSKENRNKIEKEVLAANMLGMKAEFADTPDLPFETVGAVHFPNQAQLNPKKLIAGLMKEVDASKDIQIYEGMKVDEWMKGTTWSEIHATIPQNIICASHFPFYNKAGQYNSKLYKESAYIVALEGVEQLNGMYADEKKTGLQLRSYGDLLLMAGGVCRIGKRGRGQGWNQLKRAAEQYYPAATEKAHWEVQECMSVDGIPYIGAYSGKTPNFYVATGFNGWGMTLAMSAALLLTDIILNGEKGKGATETYPWGEVFYPGRKVLLPQYIFTAKEGLLKMLTSGLKNRK